MGRGLAALAIVGSVAVGCVCGVVGARYAIAHRMEASGEQLNGWRVNFNLGRFGSDLLLRAAVARYGMGANEAEESVYYSAPTDFDKRPLDGRSNYVLHFDKGALPPVGAFWSVSVVSADDLFFVENSIARYGIGDRTKGLTRNPDGSLDIRIQHDEPAEGQANWLPAPAGGFVIIMRAYEPKAEILTRKWAPPPVKRADTLA
ncbi:MAG: DUF1214 domain-containing protein [Hyphomicrobiales bacterium]|nr:DUF1214 domain-containing protein [Hyphomicrobiales bacterium]